MIRLATGADAAAIAGIYRPIVESTAISFETVPPDSAEMRHRIEETLRGYPWLVCEKEGVISGYAYAARHRARAAYQWSVDTSVYVDDRFRRRGIGRGLYLSLFAILSAQGFVNAYAGIALPSPASVALHEQVGFTPIGVYRRVGYKLGAWRDVGWWQKALAGSTPAPAPIRSPSEVLGRPDWNSLLATGETVMR